MTDVDLKKAYFDRDLTEAEEDRLEAEILSSPEAALHFIAHARSAYLGLGLPDPLKKNPPFGLLGGALLVVAVAGIWWGTQRSGLFPASTHASASGSQEPIAVGGTSSGTVAARSSRLAEEARTSPGMPSTMEAKAGERTMPGTKSYADGVSGTEKIAAPIVPSRLRTDEPVDQSPAGAVASIATGMVKPLEYVPGRRYGGLCVIVDQRSEGLVTVRVLDPAGNEVRLLYAGILRAGRWTFDWEGRLQNGRTAAPGAYTVETQSGDALLQKRVLVGQE